MCHLGKQHTDALQDKKIRKRLAKLVLFKYQWGATTSASSPYISKIACVDFCTLLTLGSYGVVTGSLLVTQVSDHYSVTYRLDRTGIYMYFYLSKL